MITKGHTRQVCSFFEIFMKFLATWVLTSSTLVQFHFHTNTIKFFLLNLVLNTVARLDLKKFTWTCFAYKSNCLESITLCQWERFNLLYKYGTPEPNYLLQFTLTIQQSRANKVFFNPNCFTDLFIKICVYLVSFFVRVFSILAHRV